jgi:Uma2 family endonuclease
MQESLMSLLTSRASAETDDESLYPSSDGEPMAETPIHVRAMMMLLQAMDDFLAALTHIYVAANSFWYFKEGDPKSRRAPDLMVIKGVGRAERRSFFSWRENNAVPCVIVEVSSKKKWREDLYEKRALYARLGVREYYLFDPEGKYLQPALMGFRRDEHGTSVPVKPDAEGRLKCAELGLYFRAEGPMLRLIDAATDKPVLTKDEQLAENQKRIADLEAKLAKKGRRKKS